MKTDSEPVAMDVFGDLLDEAKYRVKIHSSGQMSYKIAGKTDTFCQMNLFFFPFDQQMCFLEFTSWTYSESQLKFRELAKSLDVEKFAENEQWSLVRTEVTYFPFNISQTTLSVIRITLYVKRKPLYHTLTLIIPCILVSYLITLIFLLPADSKEKSIFGISTLLTYNVFQASINDRMPKAAQSLPIITIYISAVMFFSAISILASIFVLMVYYDKSSQPPTPFLQKIIPKNKLKYIKSNLQHLQKSKEQSNCLQTSYIGNYHTSRSKLGAHVRTKEPSKTREDSKKRAAKRWKKLGIKILDKVARRKQLTTKLLTSRLFKNILKSDLPSPEDDVRLLWVAVAEQIDLYLFYSFFIVNSVAAITFLLYLPLRAPS